MNQLIFYHKNSWVLHYAHSQIVQLNHKKKKELNSPLSLITLLDETDQFYDVTFEIEGTTKKAHKCILGVRCTQFKELFTKYKKDQVIPLPNVKKDLFDILLSYCYGEAVPITLNLCLALLELCEQFTVHDLKNKIDMILSNDVSVNSIQYLTYAYTYNLAKLKMACLNKINLDIASGTLQISKLNNLRKEEIIDLLNLGFEKTKFHPIVEPLHFNTSDPKKRNSRKFR